MTQSQKRRLLAECVFALWVAVLVSGLILTVVNWQ